VNLNPLVLPGCAVAILASVWGMERISDRTEPPGPIHIAYWEKWTGFERDAMQAVVDDFNKSQNRIHVDLVATSDVGNKTMFAVSAGCPPDVAGLWGDNVAHYADDRAVIPLDDFCRQYGITAADYIPCYWKLVNYDGHTWALPSTPSSSALHYNTALLRKLGFDPDRPPKTIEELTRMSDAMTFKKNGHLEKAGFMPSQPGNWNWGWGYLFGGKLWDGEDKITTDTPENIRASRTASAMSPRPRTRSSPDRSFLSWRGSGPTISSTNTRLISSLASRLSPIPPIAPTWPAAPS